MKYFVHPHFTLHTAVSTVCAISLHYSITVTLLSFVCPSVEFVSVCMYGYVCVSGVDSTALALPYFLFSTSVAVVGG